MGELGTTRDERSLVLTIGPEGASLVFGLMLGPAATMLGGALTAALIDFDPGIVWSALLIALAVGVSLAFRPRLIIHRNSASVRNLFRTHSVVLSDVTFVVVTSPRSFMRPMPVLALRVASPQGASTEVLMLATARWTRRARRDVSEVLRTRLGPLMSDVSEYVDT